MASSHLPQDMEFESVSLLRTGIICATFSPDWDGPKSDQTAEGLQFRPGDRPRYSIGLAYSTNELFDWYCPPNMLWIKSPNDGICRELKATLAAINSSFFKHITLSFPKRLPATHWEMARRQI
ncbi:unnamed protein product [Protopolystoma xenopodis]|uniref:Uncharacterized protein n=1 Tax=Protopolystoma xenopodis TaxID=117903 RepID=A0A3S5AHY8_9PLAT|nr:unnamed protein product [Protopolystoma xenopodis]